MIPTFEKFIEDASAGAEKIFGQTGELLPMYHFICRNGEEMVIPAPRGDKDSSVALIKALFEARDVVRYVFIDEAWLVIPKDTTDEQGAVALATQNRLFEHPNRLEVLMLHGEDEQEGLLCGRRDIIRSKGRPRLGPLQIERITGAEGRMVGLLPKQGTVRPPTRA